MTKDLLSAGAYQKHCHPGPLSLPPSCATCFPSLMFSNKLRTIFSINVWFNKELEVIQRLGKIRLVLSRVYINFLHIVDLKE